MKSEFALAFNQICAEYSLPREVVLDAIRAALVTAYRRDWKVSSTQNVLAEISLDTGLPKIYIERAIVEEVEDADTQITLENARKYKPTSEPGESVMVEVTPGDFGRIAAQTAKQVITQRLREAERESQFNRFSRQENEIIIGTIQAITPHGITLHLDRTEEAHMPRREQIPGEHYTLHQKIRVYVLEVKRTPRGPEIIVSRSHPLMLRRLLELEVPEIRSGQVEIKTIAREAGGRSKISVDARQAGLDPVGACVGMRGIRIQTISRELNGERIDVIEWNKDPKVFISNALSMNHVLGVSLDEDNLGGRTAAVMVMDDQLSLAIGRSGQNARLAAKLTGWRVDIQGATEAALWALEQVNNTPELVDNLRGAAALIPQLANIMHTHESERYPYTDEECKIIKAGTEALREVIIAHRNAEQRAGGKQARARRSAQEHVEAQRREAKVEARKRVPESAYEHNVQTLELSEKVLGHLLRNGLKSIGEVMERLALGDEALLMLNGVGIKALRQIKLAVEESGQKFEDLTPPEPEAAPEEAVVATTHPETASTGVVAESVALDEEVVESEIEEVVSGESVEAAPVEAAATQEIAPEKKEETKPLEEIFKAAKPAYTVYEEEVDLLDPDSKKSKKKKKHHAVIYDDESGETYVKRSRRSNAWEEYGDDF